MSSLLHLLAVVVVAAFIVAQAEARDRRRSRGKGGGRGGSPAARKEERPNLDAKTREYLNKFHERVARKHGRTNRRSRKPRADRTDKTEMSANREILEDLFEMDIVLSLPQAEELYNRDNIQRAVTGSVSNKWTKVIPYSIDFSGDSERVSAIEAGLDQWRDGTCLQFSRSAQASDSINFIIGGGCYSYVGRIGGNQDISIAYGCEYPGIVAHEVGHALGAWHEQSRPDRDTYVNIVIGNVASGYEGNFQLLGIGDTNDQDVAFDFGSVMHYGPTAFSSNGRNTIDPKSSYALFSQTYGQRAGLSFADIKQMNLLYCKDSCSREQSCENGGYTDPKDCGACRCPPGFGGRVCGDVEDSPCGGDRFASSDWQTISSAGTDCVFRLLANGGGRIELEMTSMQYGSARTCSSNYVEVKAGSNFDVTGARLCGSELSSLESESDQVVLIHRGSGGFTARFRQVGGSPVTQTPRPTTTTRRPRTTTTESPSCSRCRRWGNWGSWGDCSIPCGGCGRRSRTRTCVMGCVGLEKTQSRPCKGKENRVACPVGGEYEYEYELDGARHPTTGADGECCEGFRLNRRGTYCRRIRD